ncbi:hypothetical protein B9Z19DRAFT_410404 [Tuber borchii]|uniref:Uncharacterized protein n=1 Tax=Tuber borchii TaxID=42251 RepID=A0A2T6ZGT7_TUBBO|nr:hypothetical protein B9Z19DRAFT_410404 [Tuber borchii]
MFRPILRPMLNQSVFRPALLGKVIRPALVLPISPRPVPAPVVLFARRGSSMFLLPNTNLIVLTPPSPPPKWMTAALLKSSPRSMGSFNQLRMISKWLVTSTSPVS